MSMAEKRVGAERGDEAERIKGGVRVRVVRGEDETGAEVGLICDCGPKMTVHQLKLHLQASLPESPAFDTMRLICAGHELRGEDLVIAVVPQGTPSGDPYPLHVVTAPTLRRRTINLGIPAHEQEGVIAQAMPDYTTYWQQACMNYHYQSLLWQHWAMAMEREGTGGENGAPAAPPPQPEQPAAAAAPAPAQAMDDQAEEEGDWWERAYGIFRLCAILCLMYAYSSTGRILLLLVILVALLVARPGQWRRLQGGQRQLPPEDPELLLPEGPEGQGPAADGAAPEAPAPDAPVPEAPIPDVPVHHSRLAAGWLIITTFFTSLIPDATE